jgi:very-short-patch-repair endonuclease
MKYESPIEEKIGERLKVTLASNVRLSLQVPIRGYRVDMMLTHKSGRKVVIECDGAEFHNFQNDRHRDMELLQAGVLAVMRLNGSDIIYAPDACIGRIKSYLPEMFSGGKSLGMEDLIMLNRSGEPITPIFRFLTSKLAWMQLPATIRELPGIALDSTGNAMMVSLCAPNWSRHYDGAPAAAMADCLRWAMGDPE